MIERRQRERERQRARNNKTVEDWEIYVKSAIFCIYGVVKKVPLQAWSGPVGSRKLRLPDIMTTAQGGGKVVSLTHRPPLPPGNAPGTHFC